MQVIKLGDKEIAVSELNADDSKTVDDEILKSIMSILECSSEWSKSTFELVTEKPKLFINLMSLSTGLKKKRIKSLPAKDFDSLAFVFLSVNAEFFIQRLKLIQMVK